MIRAAATILVLAAGTGPAAAQPVPRAPSPAEAQRAEAPARRPSPAARGLAEPPRAKPAPGVAGGPPSPKGQATGPEAEPGPANATARPQSAQPPLAPAGEDAGATPPANDGAGGVPFAPPGGPAPVHRGALIPPPSDSAPNSRRPGAPPVPPDGGVAAPGNPAPPVPAPPPEPLPSPAPEALREEDFAYSVCRLELFLLGAAVAEVAPVTDPGQRDCGIARPVRVDRLLPGVAMEGDAVLRCDTARALARWMDRVVLPAAGHLPGAPRVTGVVPGSAYQCRPVVGDGGAPRLSEHATGNAIDIAGFRLDDGTTLAVAPRTGRGDMTEAFQSAVQGSACLFFATVLGPGSNDAHDDHLHLDIKARQGGFRLCQ
ncbi:extensin family protein [Paracoccus endophyticus]|uniref:extensin-like domain-containing protein n=1 Tax=Paracoccus endophyticus TaxID=2233774 RepID=UPI001F0CC69B|nr:extensin family protein [Paracoccus endophyticus]